jgi:tetratricopeptide (TPR) repeat protein
VLQKKKKITKKEIKQDTLVTTFYKFNTFFQEHQMKIYIGAAVFALIIVAVVLYSNKKENDNLMAATLLTKVIPLYDAAQYEQAIAGDKAQNITGLKEIVDRYEGTEQGETAKIYLANCYLLTGKIDEAYELYDDYGGSNPLLKATSLAGKAAYYEAKEEYEDAAEFYRKAASVTKENPSNPEYLLKAGIALLNANQKEEAKKLFLKIQEEYKDYPQKQEVNRYLALAEN